MAQKRVTVDKDAGAAEAERGLSELAKGLVGSEILRISATIRELRAAGAKVCDLTVGDFKASEFPIPQMLREGTAQALDAGQTNYPPSDGILEARKAVAAYYADRLGLAYPVESVLVCGGARPAIYATYRALVDPGEVVVYPTPSWNNNHYTFLAAARGVELPCDVTTHFQPTARAVAEKSRGARLVVVNTPLNPTGTLMPPSEVEALGHFLVDENARRAKAGEKPLYLLYDHVYWALNFGTVAHSTPVGLVPESAPYVVFVDAISKAFAATGMRVGWAVGPRAVIERMRDLLGHVGAWAPRAEQVATARLLADRKAVDAYHAETLPRIKARLEALHKGLSAMRAKGLPVDAVEPEGAIYLTARFNLIGRAASDGRRFETNEQIRAYLLAEALFAAVPFQAFGVRGENGWFRLSVGAVSLQEIAEALPRLEAALAKVS
jgi:aspartate aminotransferase